tara:strand:+ start:183 stop:389 length:207 start_codon:yes stop_codon:yes gene_type:complete
MVKPVDITKTVIVPKPQDKQENLKSFFIGYVDQYIEPVTTEVTVDVPETVKQPHLDNSKPDTKWREIY